MKVLGINYSGYSSAAALVVDGRIVAAAEEERFTGRKHDGSFPAHAISYCLAEGGIRPDELHCAAVAWDPWRGALSNLVHMARHLPSSLNLLRDRSSLFRQQAGLGSRLRRELGAPELRVRFYDHHLSHAASAALVSPFQSCAVMTVDATGERSSCAIYRCDRGSFALLHEVRFPHSLGLLYSAVTVHLGSYHHGGEGKIMALAAFGKPRYRRLFEGMVRPRGSGIAMDLGYFEFHRHGKRRWLSSRALALLPPPVPQGSVPNHDHEDLAASLQARTEEMLLHLASSARSLTGETRLCYSGGVALNCAANGRLLREGPFEEVFVQPAANDAGSALGAALYAASGLGDALTDRCRPFSPYLGPSYGEASLLAALGGSGLRCRREEDVASAAADLLAGGKVIGWFQGRAEFGPRALGNRSILADPRDIRVKERLDTRIKRREPYRPYAPAVPWDRAGEFFEMDRPSPFMLFTFPVRDAARRTVPAVVHADGTARVQSVTPDDNALFHRLLVEFGRRTGVPVLLNTSLNQRGQPMAGSPEAAVAMLSDTDLDALVMGDFVVEK